MQQHGSFWFFPHDFVTYLEVKTVMRVKEEHEPAVIVNIVLAQRAITSTHLLIRFVI